MPKINVDLTAVRASGFYIPMLKEVLDAAYEDIPGTAAEQDAAILAAGNKLRKQYEDLTVGQDIDYSSEACRFVYIFRYVVSFASIVEALIARVPELSKLFTRETLTVCSLGGGPGSEYLGICEYLQERRLSPKIDLTLYDKEPGWSDSWHAIDKKVGTARTISRTFKQLDATDPKTWSKEKKAYRDADLITLVYFMSEVYKHRAKR